MNAPLARMAWCLSGAAAAIFLALLVTAPSASPLLLASLGGSTVFLFGLTHTPAAQPRALFGGHLGGALIGIGCYQAFGDATWVYTLATVITVAYLLVTGTVHPPAGANPLIMIQAHAGYAVLLQPVFLGVAALAGVAFVWSRLVPRLRPYPSKWLARSPASLFAGWEI